MDDILNFRLDSFMDESFDIHECLKSNEFVEIWHMTESVHNMLKDELILTEEVHSSHIGLRKDASKIIHNTVDTTRSANKIAGEVSDAEAGVFKATYDLVAKVAGLAGKFIGWILKWVEKIPTLVIKIIDKITGIPANIRMKIRGDIKLYITVNDLQEIYNQTNGYTLIRNIEEYIANGSKLVSLEGFDKSLEKTMAKLTAKIKGVTFSQTMIDLSKEENRNIYLGGQPACTIDGEEITYKEALIHFDNDIKGMKKSLEDIKSEYAKKVSNPDARVEISNMSAGKQALVNTVSETNIMVLTFITDMLKYIMADMSAIDKAFQKIEKNGGLPKKFTGKARAVKLDSLPQDAVGRVRKQLEGKGFTLESCRKEGDTYVFIGKNKDGNIEEFKYAVADIEGKPVGRDVTMEDVPEEIRKEAEAYFTKHKVSEIAGISHDGDEWTFSGINNSNGKVVKYTAKQKILSRNDEIIKHFQDKGYEVKSVNKINDDKYEAVASKKGARDFHRWIVMNGKAVRHVNGKNDEKLENI